MYTAFAGSRPLMASELFSGAKYTARRRTSHGPSSARAVFKAMTPSADKIKVPSTRNLIGNSLVVTSRRNNNGRAAGFLSVLSETVWREPTRRKGFGRRLPPPWALSKTKGLQADVEYTLRVRDPRMTII